MQKAINVAMTQCIKKGGWRGLVNISLLPKSVWPNLQNERIYFDAKKKEKSYLSCSQLKPCKIKNKYRLLLLMTQRRNPLRRLNLALNHLKDYINILVVVKLGFGLRIPIREDSVKRALLL